jgi:hypothetical protein
MSTKSLLIGYDLNQPGQDYSSLTKEIKELGSNWWHHLDSTWIVRTTKTVVEVRDLLRQHIDASDELLVVDLAGNGAWWGFNEKGSSWLKENI